MCLKRTMKPVPSTMRTFFGLWVGVCCLAWTLPEVKAEENIDENNLQRVHSSADDSVEPLDEHESRVAADIQQMFGVEEMNSICDANYGNCKCRDQNCGCCLNVNLPKIWLVGICCVNVSYLAEDIGLKVAFSFNDHVLIERQVAVKDPTEFCFGIPYIARALGVCVKLYGLHRENKALCGCVNVGFRLVVPVISYKVGCFGIPIDDGEEAERIDRSFN